MALCGYSLSIFPFCFGLFRKKTSSSSSKHYPNYVEIGYLNSSLFIPIYPESSFISVVTTAIQVPYGLPLSLRACLVTGEKSIDVMILHYYWNKDSSL